MKTILTALSLFIIFSAFAQENFENTKFLAADAPPANASITDAAWIAGYWKGEAFGGIIEELWAPPVGNSMLGSFKLTVNGETSFYEFQSISEENNSLVLRLKHFHANLDGWEEKNEKLEWKLVEVTPNKIYFSGFTFEKVDENHLNIYVVFNENGERSEMKFSYEREKL